MVHSATQYLGVPEGGIGIYYKALQEILDLDGGRGTLVVPTFTLGFAHGQVFNQNETPSENMGTLSEYVRLLPVAHRSPHPLHSVAVVGRFANELASIDTSGAFDVGSIFERMVALDFKLLLLGADVYYATMIHYCERKMGVPYRYWKDFTGEVQLSGKSPKIKTYRMFARDLNLDPHVDATPVRLELERRGLWASVDLNYGKVASCRFYDFVSVAENLLQTNPWALVTNRKAENPAGGKEQEEM